MFKRNMLVGAAVALLIATFTSVTDVNAGDQVLSINSGNTSSSWFISGEASLVMNGFDLNGLGVTLPTVIDRVSISVETAVPNTPIDLVIYEDSNGGSPADARLVSRTQVTINQAGVFTATLPAPVSITQPALWIGFYLPVDFRFLADQSGSSVLTYWAWTPNARFDLNNLSSAAVLGAADGSAPVNINMGGRARITAELVTGGTSTTVSTGQVNAGTITGDASALQPHFNCTNIFYDTADERITYQDIINVHCNQVLTYQAPPAPSGYTQRGVLYDIYFFKSGGIVTWSRISYAVTHCIRPEPADLDRAVIGLAYGQPRQWRILPTVRFNDLVCAEVQHGGNLAYFLSF
ncbi:MAG: hypothetical protein SGI73_10600 [Chloroflexota bacterium]|nr:hypothetical protein [Chloroflexota bacterium]